MNTVSAFGSAGGRGPERSPPSKFMKSNEGQIRGDTSAAANAISHERIPAKQRVKSGVANTHKYF